MSNTSIQLKKSGATGNTPSGLAYGEVAINYADGKLYYKNALGGTSYISNQFSFDTINANNSLILATGVSDTLSFVAGNNITISTNTTTKTITINSSGGSTDQFARDTANASFIQANAAFNKANTTSGNAQYINSGTSNVYFASANGNILANVDGNTIVTITANGLVTAGVSGDISGANVIYANTFIATNAAIIAGINVVPYIQSAYTQANTANTNAATADSKAVSAGDYANSAFAVANTDVTNVSVTPGTYGGTTAIPVVTVSANGRVTAVTNAAITTATGSFINSGTSNVFFSSANGSIIANVAGNTIFSITANGIVTAGESGDISGANVIYANTFVGTNAAIIAGINVVPYIQSVFTQANSAYASQNTTGSYANSAFAVANTDVTNVSVTPGIYGGTTAIPVVTIAANGRITSVTNAAITATGSFINSGTSNVYFSGANGSIIANVAGNTIFSITANGIVTAGASGDISGANAIYANTVISANGIVVDGLNVVPYVQSAFAQANAAFTRANSVTSGFRANTVIIANSTGYLSNSNAEFSLANNTLYVPNANVSSELTANSLVFYDGTRLNSATGISANTANSAATANVSIFARVTNVTTGTYFPIITDTTVTGADTFHYSSNDFLMYAANNTFRVSGNVWAGQFITVGSNIPVVNATGHWVGKPLVANNSATANVSNVAVNARITNVTTGTYFPIVTDTTITGADTFHYSSNDFLMYAANNTFRATGNLWAGQFLTVGTNIPVVNSTGHWVGQTLTSTDETARTTANSAGSYANSAFLQANAAFAAANLASSNVYSFVGTGSCTSFTLSTTNSPTSNSVIVNVDGVIQLHSTYDVSSNVVIFSEAPASNAEIEVQIITGASGSTNNLTLTPEVNTTSGTSVVLTTAIPSWAKRITVNFYGISLSGTQLPLIQFGTGATPTWATSGYDSASDNYATTAGPVEGSTAGFVIGSASSAAQAHNGAYTFTLVGSNKWVGTMNGNIAGADQVLFGGGRVSLPGEVTAIRLFTTGGTNTYDAGSASVMYE